MQSLKCLKPRIYVLVLISAIALLCVIKSIAEEESEKPALPLLPPGTTANVDFLVGDGSYILSYFANDAKVYSIQIKGPVDPDIESPVLVRHSVTPNIDSSFVTFSIDDMKSFVRTRFISSDPISARESSFLAVLLIHQQGIAPIKNWGFGVAHVWNGNWPLVFREPKRWGESRNDRSKVPESE